MKRLTDRQVDHLARTLIYMWGTVAIWNGVETNSSQWEYCSLWAYECYSPGCGGRGPAAPHREWDAEAAARVEARMRELEPAFEARYRREGE